jgi:hypothetical protein
MPEWLSEALEMAKPYWPFLAQVLVMWFVGQNMKKRVFTKARAAGGGAWALARDTMWLHPAAMGVGWGLAYPFMPAVEFVTSRGGAVTQGLIAWVVSIAGYRLLEAVAEKRGWTAVLKFLRETGRPTMPPPADGAA